MSAQGRAGDTHGGKPRPVRLRHATTYRYDRPVALGPHVVRLRPSLPADGRVLDYSFHVTPEPLSLRWQEDPLGNWIARLIFGERTRELRLDVGVVVDMAPINPFDFLVEPTAERWPLNYSSGLALELAGSSAPAAAGPRLNEFLDAYRGLTDRDSLDVLIGLNRDLHERVRYIVRPQGEVQSPEETLDLGTGSCRDSAWLLVQVLRNLGCAARFVSGYLVPSGMPAGASVTADSAEEDEAGLHAWSAVYLPGAGWLGLDPSSGTLCAEAHLRLAATNHYASAAPVDGTSELANVEVSFHLEATPVGTE